MHAPRSASRSRYNSSMRRVSRIVLASGCAASLLRFYRQRRLAHLRIRNRPRRRYLQQHRKPRLQQHPLPRLQQRLSCRRSWWPAAARRSPFSTRAGASRCRHLCRTFRIRQSQPDATGRAMFVAPSGATALYADLRNGGAPTMAPIAPRSPTPRTARLRSRLSVRLQSPVRSRKSPAFLA